MIPKLFEILVVNEDVTDLLGLNPTKVYPWGEAPEKTPFPYVTYLVYSGNPENCMDRVPDMDNLGVQVDVWAETGSSCDEVTIAVRNALEPTNHMTNISSMTRDAETKAYRRRMDFDMFTER